MYIAASGTNWSLACHYISQIWGSMWRTPGVCCKNVKWHLHSLETCHKGEDRAHSKGNILLPTWVSCGHTIIFSVHSDSAHPTGLQLETKAFSLTSPCKSVTQFHVSLPRLHRVKASHNSAFLRISRVKALEKQGYVATNNCKF
uniref:Uncharacterized protein n=1 Tax=Arundo donax TaxID=35708 RepID=A0A0A9B4A0_ARUDO